MNRRDFMKEAAAGLAIAQISTSPSSETPAALPPENWLRNTPFVAVGCWDDMPIFVRRAGGESTQAEENYLREHSEEAVAKLKDLGVTVAIIDFFKGFGLEAEKEHIDSARRLAGSLHDHGIKVGLYVGSTIMYETFLLEEPKAQEWFVPDYLGKPVIYDHQTFRKRVYFMHPGYVEYIQHAVRMGIEELHADLIHFDNTSLQARPEVFQHPLAIDHFREYLRTTYSGAELKRRLGFSNVEFVLPPQVSWPITRIDDPMFQLWAEFRCHQLNRYYSEMRSYIRGLNPSVVMDCNPSSGMSGTNTIWAQGISYPGLYPQLDISWTEEGDRPGVTSEGILVSKIRTYKTAGILGPQILTYTAGRGHYGANTSGTVAMAESMAFNRQSLGMVGGILDAPTLPADQKRYIEFFHQQFEHYTGVQSIPDVAVLYSFSSMGFDNDRPAVNFMLFTQALIQARVPFNIVFDRHLTDLSKYRLLVLADQECLSDDQVKLIESYVQNGGGLVATEQSSLYTERFLRRPDFALKSLFKISALPSQGRSEAEKALEIPPVQNLIGKGRCSYIPAIQEAIEKPPAQPMGSRYWKLPLNHVELIEQVRWAAGGKFSLEVDAPNTQAVVAELQDQERQSRRLVHLLNYAAADGNSVNNLIVDVQIPQGQRVGQVSLLTPGGPDISNIPVNVRDGRATFTVPHLETYVLSIISLE